MSQPTNTRANAHHPAQSSTSSGIDPLKPIDSGNSNKTQQPSSTPSANNIAHRISTPLTGSVATSSDASTKTSDVIRTSIKRSSSPSSGAVSPDGLAKKRAATAASTDADSIINYKKWNLEHRSARLKVIKEKYSDHVAELFFLQTNGNMMDYATWRKKANTPDYLHFIKAFRLEAPLVDTMPVSTPKNAPVPVPIGQSTPTHLPHGVEIKITGVGVTPVAVSTTLPAAVAQLSQQG